jgi:nitrogen regulatory protein P-II 2
MEVEMLTTPLKLVTVVGESVLSERLPAELRALGATGWTMSSAHGSGSRGMRSSVVPGDNLRIEVVVSESLADRILTVLATDYFPNYALVAWVSDVQVVRGDKYLEPPGA